MEKDFNGYVIGDEAVEGVFIGNVAHTNKMKLREEGRAFEYVGRGTKKWLGSVLGNPFHVGTDGSHMKVIEMYHVWLWRKMQDPESEVLAELIRLVMIWADEGELLLLCHCRPRSCHADRILMAMHWLRKQCDDSYFEGRKI